MEEKTNKEKPQKKEFNKDKKFVHIVRIANTDIDGKKNLFQGLKKIKGINESLIISLCKKIDMPINKRLGELTEVEKKKIEDAVKSIGPETFPKWMLNRQKDPQTGEYNHLIGTDLIIAREEDLKIMKKTKSYAGLRHSRNLPVRGQRTQSNFRKKRKVKKIKKSSKTTQ